MKQRLAGVVGALAERTDELAHVLAETIIGEGRQSGLAVVVPHDRRLRGHAANDLRSILDAMVADNRFDPAPATRLRRPLHPRHAV